jgi:hypothetical protein
VGAVLPLSLLLVVPTSSLAGEGNVPRGAASAAAFAAPHAVVRVVPASPNPAPKLVAIDLEAAAHCARSPALVGDACSFSTGMTSRRVVEDGTPWSWTGVLEPRALEGDIATPYMVDADFVLLETDIPLDTTLRLACLLYAAPSLPTSLTHTLFLSTLVFF